MSTVLVTGGSGFIGSNSILQLLAVGHQVRTTVRNLKREADVRAMLREGGAEPGERSSFIAADLGADAGWSEAVAGCQYVLHVASPIPPGAPKHEDELIPPARDGALRGKPASNALTRRKTPGPDKPSSDCNCSQHSCPQWWPGFCLASDVVFGAFLTVRLIRHPERVSFEER